jgi:hypothetical protein
LGTGLAVFTGFTGFTRVTLFALFALFARDALISLFTLNPGFAPDPLLALTACYETDAHTKSAQDQYLQE